MAHPGSYPGRSGLPILLAVVVTALALNVLLMSRWLEPDARRMPGVSVTTPEPARPDEGTNEPGSGASRRESGRFEPIHAKPPTAMRDRPGRPGPAPDQTARGRDAAAPAPVQRTGPGQPPAGPDHPPAAVLLPPAKQAAGPAAPPASGRTSRPAREERPGAASSAPPPASPAQGQLLDHVLPAEPEPVEPGSDRTPPRLQAIRFEPALVDAGRVTKLSVQASDDLSGVASFKGELLSPGGRARLPFWSAGTTRDDPGSFALTIPREAEAGVWYVSEITITDRAGNPRTVKAPSAAQAPQGGTLTVSSPDADSTPPVVQQVRFEHAVVGAGEANTIEIEARDDRSGIVSIKGACGSPSGFAEAWFTCTWDAPTESWKGKVVVPVDSECGEWSVRKLWLQDKAGNTITLGADSPLLAQARFQMSGAGCDDSPPVLSAIDISPSVVTNETAVEILLTASIHDEGSGIANVMGWFEGPVSTGGQRPRSTFNCSPDQASPGDQWICKVKVPQFAARGTWALLMLRLVDKAWNTRDYGPSDPVVSGLSFEVQ